MIFRFLDPEKPISTCISEDCHDCPLRGHLQCHFRSRDLLRFLLIAFPAFLLGGLGIVQLVTWLLFPWLAFILIYFGFVEIRVMCSHCPHYHEPGTRSLQCWANYGMPKIWKYRPGPMSRNERAIFYFGLILVAAYPLVCLLVGAQWLLLILFIISISGMAVLMGQLMCNRCMNFACPFNHSDPESKELFFTNNPVVSQAWQTKNTK